MKTKTFKFLSSYVGQVQNLEELLNAIQAAISDTIYFTPDEKLDYTKRFLKLNQKGGACYTQV